MKSLRDKRLFVGIALVASSLALILSSAMTGVVSAQTASDFSLQVTPSPLVTTLKPGTTTDLELKIRNGGTGTEDLKIEPRRFKIDERTGQVNLDDTTPSEITPWIKFGAPRFSVKPGEWYTQKISIALPKDTGFSYSLVLVISRVNNPAPANMSGRAIRGSLAVFTLINVDRPGAVRKLAIEDLSTSAGIYEYLPAKINVTFRNMGNTIVQPYGNVFIQQGANTGEPLATLAVNDKGGYILPGSKRTLEAQWSAGFPTYQISTQSDGTEKKTEVWDWSQLSKFRIGQYTAKVVGVYNDGQRDVPIEKEVTFWVLPWKIIGGALVVILIVGFGIWTILRKFWRIVRHDKTRLSK